MASAWLDRVEQGLSRVAQEYQESPNFLAFLTALLELQQDSEDTLQQLALQTSIDNAQGAQLYTIATIVGAPIVYTNDMASPFIGFKDQTGGLPFWDETDQFIQGGQWREDGEVETTVEDLWDAERLVIRCEIVRNTSDGSGDSIQRAMMFLFPNINCIVYDHQDMSFSLGIGRYLTQIEQELLTTYDILPRPVGVRLDQITAYDDPVFGFSDITNASGFDIGHWANEIPTTRRRLLSNIVLIPTKR